jgi:hypothetical protein
MKALYASNIQDNQAVDSLFLVSAKNHGVSNSWIEAGKSKGGFGTGRMIWGEASTKMTSFESEGKRFCIKEKYKFGFRMS